jgi:hypothetical protein
MGANPDGISTIVSTLMPLVISSVADRAMSAGGAGLGGGESAVEHEAAPKPTAAMTAIRKDLYIEKR